MAIVHTPAERFADLPDFPFEPHWADIHDAEHGTLRMHYVDHGPADGDVVLLLHGQPTWSFLYRKVIAELARRDHRAIAPDYIGFGRSDKITDRLSYTFQGHIDWMRTFVQAIDLRDATVFVQDWGGPIGFALLAAEPDRFARVVAADTVLHTCEPWLAGKLAWANHGIEDGRIVVEEALLDWMKATQRVRDLSPGAIVGSITVEDLPPEVVAAYDAPFPDEEHRAGLRQMNTMIPVSRNDPGAVICAASFDALRGWHKPFLTVWAEDDPGTGGWETVFQEEVPGARGQPHVILEGARHFVQEDKGPEIGRIISDFIAATPA